MLNTEGQLLDSHEAYIFRMFMLKKVKMEEISSSELLVTTYKTSHSRSQSSGHRGEYPEYYKVTFV